MVDMLLKGPGSPNAPFFPGDSGDSDPDYSPSETSSCTDSTISGISEETFDSADSAAKRAKIDTEETGYTPPLTRARARRIARESADRTVGKTRAVFRAHQARVSLGTSASFDDTLDALVSEDTRLFRLLQDCQSRTVLANQQGLHKDKEEYETALKRLEAIGQRFQSINERTGEYLEEEGDHSDYVEFYRTTLEQIQEDLAEFMKQYGAWNIEQILNTVLTSEEQALFTPEAHEVLASLLPYFSPLGVQIGDTDCDPYVCTFHAEDDPEAMAFLDEEAMMQGRPYISPEGTVHSRHSFFERIQGAELIIPLGMQPEKALIIRGIFQHDGVHLARLRGPFAERASAFEAAADTRLEVPADFAAAYFEQYSMRDFLTKTPEEYAAELGKAYDEMLILESGGLLMTLLGNKKLDLESLLRKIGLLLLSDSPEQAHFLCSVLSEAVPDFKIFLKQTLHPSLQLKLHDAEKSIQEIKKRLEALNPEDVSFEMQIMASKMSEATKSRALQFAKQMNSPGGEGGKVKAWLQRLLSIPFGHFVSESVTAAQSPAEIQAHLDRVKATLDGAVHGHEGAKREILRVVAQWVANGGANGECIALQGPPGNGKTTLAREGIAKALGRPFVFIPLGGISDASYLIGHEFTYVGSGPGLIAKKLAEAKAMNPVIFFDEADKLSKTAKGEEITGILTHLIDSSQNKEFFDKYFDGVPIDLSRALFVFSFNDESLVDPILKDRMTVIRTRGHSAPAKVTIAQKYLLPDILRSMHMSPDDVTISEEVIKYLVENYTHEAGVRKLKEKLFAIAREINLERLTGQTKLPVAIDLDLIHKHLEEPHTSFDRIPAKPMVGSVNGLYATAAGTGGLTMIQTFRTLGDSHLELKLTGSQGDVMQESMEAARTVAWNLLPEALRDQIREGKPFGLHIHAPDTAMPKDGPSAGGAITASIISQLTGVPIRNDVATTGEIDLTGRITAIGGVHAKLRGAKKAGVKKVAIPEQNSKDLEKIRKEDPDLFSDGFEVVTVDHILDLLQHILVPNEIVFEGKVEDAMAIA